MDKIRTLDLLQHLNITVISYSRNQGCFHSEKLEDYIMGNLNDLTSENIIDCGYRAIGFTSGTWEEEQDLINRFNFLRSNTPDELWLEDHRNLKFKKKGV